MVAVGSQSRIPDLPGLDQVRYWTNREGTSASELPESLLVLGGGPTGVELAQVYARYGVPVTIVESNPRIRRETTPELGHPPPRPRGGRSDDPDRCQDGTRPSRGGTAAPRVELSDGSRVAGHAVMFAIGRAFPLDGLGLESVGVRVEKGGHPGQAPQAGPRRVGRRRSPGPSSTPTSPITRARWWSAWRSATTCGLTCGPSRGPPTPIRKPPRSGSRSTRHGAGLDAVEFPEGHRQLGQGVHGGSRGARDRGRRPRNANGGWRLPRGPRRVGGDPRGRAGREARTPLDTLADTIHAFPTLPGSWAGCSPRGAGAERLTDAGHGAAPDAPPLHQPTGSRRARATEPSAGELRRGHRHRGLPHRPQLARGNRGPAPAHRSRPPGGGPVTSVGGGVADWQAATEPRSRGWRDQTDPVTTASPGGRTCAPRPRSPAGTATEATPTRSRSVPMSPSCCRMPAPMWMPPPALRWGHRSSRPARRACPGWQTIPTSRGASVWALPRWACTALAHRPHWPSRRPSTSAVSCTSRRVRQ